MRAERVLRTIVVGGLMLVPFTPLVVTERLSFLFVTGRGEVWGRPIDVARREML